MGDVRRAHRHRLRAVALTATGCLGLATLAACGPSAPAAPPPPPPPCSPVTGLSEPGATLSPATAAHEAAQAVREATTDQADEHTLVTVESTPAGPAVTTHPVDSPGDAAAVAAQAAQGDDLVAVDTDAPVRTTATPNDPGGAQQWAFSATSFGALWPSAIGSASPPLVVAVVDTGVDTTHPDLTGQLLAGYNLLAPGQPPIDDNGHGTHVAGIIAATTNNSVGVRGAAPGVKVLPIKVLGASGAGTYSSVASGIYKAVDLGAKVVNLSLGGTTPSSVFTAAVQYAAAHGATVVAAAGNDGENGSPASYPGAAPGVVAVGAVTSSLDRASFSTCGNYVDIAAPGQGILSTVPGGGYASWSGTSMASPFVAAAVAIVQAAHPGCTPAGVTQALEASATDRGAPGRDPYFGAGVVNPQGALAAATC